MSKRDFIEMMLIAFGYGEIKIKRYKSGTNDGQSANVTIWEAKALKKDARGDRKIDFQEGTFELFIYHLSRILVRQE
jgi:hypothetical protein